MNKLTEEELLGREFSVTRERIRQIDAGVLSKMSLKGHQGDPGACAAWQQHHFHSAGQRGRNLRTVNPT